MNTHRILDLDFQHLRTFLVLARLENFSRTGEEVGLSQSAVSRQIRALEDSLGLRLFERRGRRAVLTSAGLVLREHASKLLHEATTLPRLVKDLTEGVRGELRIGACMTAANAFLPPLLAKYRQAYPGVHLALHPGSSARALEQARRGEIDVAFVAAEALPSNVDVLYEIPDEIVMVSAPHHALARRRVKPIELEESEFIRRESTSDTRALVSRWFQAQKVHLRNLMDVW